MYKIVTHPGNAHKDDFMSVCILLAKLETATVYRREATAEDLSDPNTFVVDVGMQLIPDLHNFDHHQDRGLPCAFHLVMQYFGYHEAARLVFGWYEQMSMLDVGGLYKTAKELGVNPNVLQSSSSPIDGYILSHFSRYEELSSQTFFYRFMKDFGEEMIDLIESKTERLERLQQEAQILPVGDYKAIYSPIAENPKLSVELYLKQLSDPDIVMAITPSNRGDGWELLRLEDNRFVDFRAVAKDPEVRFVHVNGFLAKTRSLLPLDEVLKIVSRAVKPKAQQAAVYP